jgi:hypothetical protein
MNYVDEDEGEDFNSPLSSILHPQFKPLAFGPSALRESDSQLCMAACAAMGCESITIHQARRWAEIERDREKRAEAAKKAKASYAKKKASRRSPSTDRTAC